VGRHTSGCIGDGVWPVVKELYSEIIMCLTKSMSITLSQPYDSQIRDAIRLVRTVLDVLLR
jgi:hypothetical protein